MLDDRISGVQNLNAVTAKLVPAAFKSCMPRQSQLYSFLACFQGLIAAQSWLWHFAATLVVGCGVLPLISGAEIGAQ